MHPDCLQLFWRHFDGTDALDLLWLAITWRKPFANIDPQLSRPSPSSYSFALAAEQCGIPQVKQLPLELQEPIQRLTGPHLLSCYAAVLDLARDVASVPLTSPMTFPLADISSWERGSIPILATEGQSLLPFVRVTIDFAGLKRIERLPRAREPGQKLEQRVSDCVFIVEKQEYLEDARAQFKVYSCLLLRAAVTDEHI